MSKHGCWALLFILLSACASDNAWRQGQWPVQDPKLTERGFEQYVIGIGDTLQIGVWDNAQLSGSVTVRPDGKITLPLLNDVQAGGLTPKQLQEDLSKRLEQFIQKPELTVGVTGTNADEFYNRIAVFGAVKTPGYAPYRSGITVMDVVLKMGGYTEFSRPNKAVLIRREGETYKEIPLKLKDILKKGALGENIPVQPGDLIYVPEGWF